MIYSGPLLYGSKLNSEDIKKLIFLCKKDKTKEANSKLVGLIDHEYDIDPVKFENIIKPKIYEGNRFSKKMPKGTFTMRLYMGLDENGEKIFKTFVGTKKQLKKVTDYPPGI